MGATHSCCADLPHCPSHYKLVANWTNVSSRSLLAAPISCLRAQQPTPSRLTRCGWYQPIRGSTPRPLNVDNVLWANWNPNRSSAQQIAFTTGKAISLAPGWEANNDLWLGELFANEEIIFEPEILVDSYPATYGWWGGNYQWSPNGRLIAYSFADEIGIIDLDSSANSDSNTGNEEDGAAFLPRQPLYRFTEYDTRADWVWVPSLSWSPDSRFIVFTAHDSLDTTQLEFDSWIVDTDTAVTGPLEQKVGIWSHPHWSPASDNDNQIAFLKSLDPLDSLRASYALWIMDQDGSNQRQIYPPAGENSFFPLISQFMDWSAKRPRFCLCVRQSTISIQLDQPRDLSDHARRCHHHPSNVGPLWGRGSRSEFTGRSPRYLIWRMIASIYCHRQTSRHTI